jgi:mannose-6-phosphate isomerase-like protein (cupin superfamily)
LDKGVFQMGLKFYKQFFTTKKEVLADIQENGTWPTTFVSGATEGPPVHWHKDEVHAYIMEGETDFLDAETNLRTIVSAGDKIIVPMGELHAEGAIKDRVVYILALPEPRLPEDFLAKFTPEERTGG